MPLPLALFGDSLAAGVGATTVADTLGPLLAAELAAAGVRAQHKVFAVSGALSSALAGQVERAGSWPRLAVVVVGTNDLMHLVPVARAAQDLAVAVRTLRATGVQVVLVPTPDLSIVAHVPPALRELARAASEGLRSAQLRVALEAGAFVADTADASAVFADDPSMFSSDLFHPSSRGYRLIAATIFPVVLAAAAEAGDADR
ncbi:MAG: SGNH/GDSL hydrolase family protein [Janthinobacterium lividum]